MVRKKLGRGRKNRCRFCTKEGLHFKLLADTEHTVSDAYDSVMEYNGSKLSKRNTFIIDPEGKIPRWYPLWKRILPFW